MIRHADFQRTLQDCIDSNIKVATIIFSGIEDTSIQHQVWTYEEMFERMHTSLIERGNLITGGNLGLLEEDSENSLIDYFMLKSHLELQIGAFEIYVKK